MEYQTKKNKKNLLTDCDHCRVRVGDELAALGLVSVEFSLPNGLLPQTFPATKCVFARTACPCQSLQTASLRADASRNMFTYLRAT